MTTAISALSLSTKFCDRRQPLALGMDQRGAGMRAVEHLVARVVDQHALQAAGDALRLAVAKDDDRGRVGVSSATRADGARTATPAATAIASPPARRPTHLSQANSRTATRPPAPNV